MPLQSGTRLGPYSVTAKIGEGGMGEVYQARDTKLDRDVALKVLPEAFTSDPDRLARFEREAKVLASLNHPNIGSIYGLEEAEGVRALVLELVEGPTLADRIKQGPIPLDEALPIAKQIAEALEAAHEAGVIHRDLKPANIKVKADGTVKVLDFGLAKAFQADPSNVSTVTVAGTEAGAILGTPAYMSPEQSRGRPVDKRTDVWAFGCVLFEMLTGLRAFGADTHSDTVAAILGRDPHWLALPSAAPSGLAGLLRRCLRKDHARRQRDLGDVSIELEELRDLRQADQAPWHRDVQPRAPRSLSLAWTIAGLGVVVTTAVVVWSVTRPSPPSAVTRTLLSVAPANRIAMNNNGQNMAISRDGRWLAFGGTTGTDRQLYLRNLAEGEARAVAGTAGARYPFFSPDGQWVGFFDGVAGQLKKVAVTGGTPVTLCAAPAARGESWGENGMIVFASPSRAALSQVSEDGGTPEPVTELDISRGETTHRQPRLLPGGHAVLFKTQGTSNDDTHIWGQSLTTGDRHRLVEDANFATYSPTGHLVYVQGGSLMAAPFDPDRLELLGPAVTVVDASVGTVQQFTLSDSGLLVYATGDSPAAGRRLVWVSRETGEAQPLAAPSGGYFHAHLSPDDERILVDSAQGVGVFEIASGVFERLGAGNWVVWAPDGRRVTYARRQAGTVYDIFGRPSDGSGTEEALVVRDLSQMPQAWSPDGRTLAFAEQDLAGVAGGIWLLSLDGDPTAEPWLQTPAIENEAQFSPDGRWIAYSSNQTGRVEVYVRSLDGDVTRPITTEGGSAPRWSEDGRELFYRSGNGMFVVEVSTDGRFERGLPSLLFEGPYLEDVNGIASYDVTGNAERFLMITRGESGAAQMQLNVVLNWHQELLERVPVN